MAKHFILGTGSTSWGIKGLLKQLEVAVAFPWIARWWGNPHRQWETRFSPPLRLQGLNSYHTAQGNNVIVGVCDSQREARRNKHRLEREERSPHGKVCCPPAPRLWMLKNSVWHPARRERDPFPQILNYHKVTLVSAQTVWVLFKKKLLAWIRGRKSSSRAPLSNLSDQVEKSVSDK